MPKLLIIKLNLNNGITCTRIWSSFRCTKNALVIRRCSRPARILHLTQMNQICKVLKQIYCAMRKANQLYLMLTYNLACLSVANHSTSMTGSAIILTGKSSLCRQMRRRSTLQRLMKLDCSQYIWRMNWLFPTDRGSNQHLKSRELSLRNNQPITKYDHQTLTFISSVRLKH